MLEHRDRFKDPAAQGARMPEKTRVVVEYTFGFKAYQHWCIAFLSSAIKWSCDTSASTILRIINFAEEWMNDDSRCVICRQVDRFELLADSQRFIPRLKAMAKDQSGKAYEN